MNKKQPKQKTKTFDRIYSIVASIPKGKVLTYRQVAKIAKTTPRVVGFAMHANKDIQNVPCHRVIKSDGTLAGYALGGPAEKKRKLQQEGIKFLNENVVNLKDHLFKPLLPFDF